MVKLLEAVDALEISSFLPGPMDKSNAIVTIKAGAGGTEACDWADLLFRMYFRWAERRGFKFTVEDVQDGEGAGISTAIVRVEGPNAYGYMKAERGVHRLVRISLRLQRAPPHLLQAHRRRRRSHRRRRCDHHRSRCSQGHLPPRGKGGQHEQAWTPPCA